MRRSIAAIPLALLLACGGGTREAPEGAPGPADTVLEREPSVDGGPGRIDVRLVGSVPWSSELASGTHRRVAVSYDGAVDTLEGIAVDAAPVVAGDSVVYGFDREGGEVERGFAWTPSGGVGTIDLPEDFLGFTAFALAPDGGHLAYAGRGEPENEEIRLVAIVRTWPNLEPVYESHRVAGYPSGGPNSSVEWFGADSIEIRIRLDDVETPGGSWLRVTGSPSTGAFSADTVSGG